jgi:hypothetical protein
MANWTEADLRKQYESAKQNGWLAHFQDAAQLHRFPVALLLAISSRETNMRNIKGDFRDGLYHGYGIMQVDIGTNPEFCKAWTPDQVKESVQCGCRILSGKRAYLAKKQITDLKAIAAAYNTGEGNVSRSVAAGQDPDRTTTGRDYGRDVLARMEVFTRLLADQT